MAIECPKEVAVGNGMFSWWSMNVCRSLISVSPQSIAPQNNLAPF